MLFNSVEFIFFFLPITLFLFHLISRRIGYEQGILFLVAASLFFYGWWNPSYILLLAASMLVNFFLGKKLGRHASRKTLTLGITLNLGLIAYYKYAGFLVFNLNTLTGASFDIGTIILPLAISFFTFQQIAYLVDSYKGITKEYNFIHYALFVSFFPQLIAGPIVHHKEMLPQFSAGNRSLSSENMAIGLSIFALGLFKKTALADGIAGYATPVFQAVDSGQSVDFFTAWGGALAYTFQLYFDFSGYSDMAIGIARMFGIILPLNFYSPYKATNISEFWRRWHITLSRFLRDYIYIPLGGNRTGNYARFRNLMITMLLGGLWHGAGWNFVIWGGLHGSYLIVNHGWQSLLEKTNLALTESRAYKMFAWALTFLAVIIGWVFFRAETLPGAVSLLQSMIGLNGISLPNAIWVRLTDLIPTLTHLPIETYIGGGTAFVQTWIWILCALTICLVFPNIYDLFSRYERAIVEKEPSNRDAFWPFMSQALKVSWAPEKTWAVTFATLLILGLLTLSQVSEFLYFQF